MKCFECDSPGPLHQHHVVPRSRGGTRTVPLCEDCHGAVHEKDLRISALTRDALAAKKDRGERLGRPRYGYRVEAGELVPYEPEQRVLRLVAELRGRGLSVRQIVAKLEARGIFTSTGRAFCARGVRRLLAA